jgi:hypothetical protein
MPEYDKVKDELNYEVFKKNEENKLPKLRKFPNNLQSQENNEKINSVPVPKADEAASHI